MRAEIPEPDALDPGMPGRPELPTRFRRMKQAIIAFAVFGVAVCLGMVATAMLDDIRIGRDRAFATADVVNVGVLRTTVRFPDETGVYHQPDRGLMYSIGLDKGQRVRVEYQKSDPRNVKVQGREWTLAWLPALSSLVVVAVVVALLWGLVQWRVRRWLATHAS